MDKTRNPIPWLSGGLATLVALFIVGVTSPNFDRAVIDHTVNPPRAYIQLQSLQVCFILALAFVPVLCIFILGSGWIFFDWIGWFVLALPFSLFWEGES